MSEIIEIPKDCVHSPVFIDFEASSLSPRSWPIEVGIAWVEDRRVEIRSKLIKPHNSWDQDDWSEVSAAVHNIPFSELDNAESAEEIAQWLIEAVGDQTLVSDAPEFDQRWLDRLTGTVKEERHAQIDDFDRILWEAFSQDGIVAPGRLHKCYNSMRSRRNTHRADEDAANLAYAYRAGMPKKERKKWIDTNSKKN
ncbi:hypothetical protein DL239_15180 [Sedimentitalea sp. CY04]|uniref:Exonuclease domain-containing protein n=1 Tax=Parasedimentitalea denitrificans TaxID=2211118 RepID=A0ABX0W9M0_9RHOB|nr:exonuclease domain-containing protein [Sedimentitalea sp. CY04]NIZ62317.1 hypothetical protein [Sedimentitalea sp. CY04]